MWNNDTAENYRKRIAALDEQMKADYGAVIETSEDYIKGVSNFVSGRVSDFLVYGEHRLTGVGLSLSYECDLIGCRDV